MAIDVGPALGFSVDSAPLKEAKRDMEAIVPAAEKAGSASERFRLQHQRTMDQMMLMQRTLQASLDVQRLMASSLDSMATSSTRVGQSFDRLIAKYDPLTAAGTRYNSALLEIDKAQKAGALSAEVAARARQQELGAYNNQVGAIERLASAQKMAAQAMVNKQTITPNRGADIAAYATELDRLRAKFNPLFAAEKEHAALLEEINQASKVGAISEAERGSAVASATAAYNKHVQALGGAAAANDNLTARSGLARHELINLGRQAQDVVVSLQGGQGLGTVLLQQGSQIADVFASSETTLAGFAAQAKGYLGGFLTAGRLAFGGVAVAITGTALALNSYLSSQQKVQMSLTGAGRASGQSVSSINSIAQSASSTTGLSISEARAFAAELAAAGKIGKDNLEPLVKIGHDIATAFGTDAAGAAQILAKAFADPVAGADELNQRLGFLDAAMQRQIQTLVAQNKVQEAQKVLQAGVASGLADVSAAVSTSTKFWTALGNIASNAWDKIGEAASRATGIGLKLGQDEQIENARKRIEELEQIASRRSAAVNKSLGTTDLLVKAKADYDALTAAAKRSADQTEAAQARQRSFAQDATMRAVLPDVGQFETFKNQTVVLEGAIQDLQKEIAGLAADEATGARLKVLTDALDKFNQALGVSKANVRDFKSEFQSSMDSLKIANDAITAFSPSAKGDIARRESLASTSKSGFDGPQREALAEQAKNNAIKQGTIALTEQARARELAANQAVDSAKLEFDMVGKSVGQQALMRANLQARQALEQQLLQQHAKWGPAQDAELAKLEEINKKYAERAQLAAIKGAQSQADFTSKTMFMSPSDVAAANVMRSLWNDEWQSHMDDALAKQVKMNSLLQQVGDISNTAFSSIAKDVANGIAPMQAIAKAAKNAAESVLDIAAKQVVGNLLGDLLGSTVGQTAGATSSATILTSAGATVAAAMIAGATEAATILGLTVPTAAAALPVAGAVTGAEVAIGGAAAGTALAAGGVMAGTAIWGPIALLMAAIVAIGGLSIFGGGDEKKKQEAARVQALNNRATLAGLDQSTLEGKLTAFDLNANVERTALPNGGKTERDWTSALTFGLFGDDGGDTTEEAIALERALAAERIAVIEDFNKKAIETEKQRVEAATKMMNDAVAMLDNVTLTDTAERLKDIQSASTDLSAALIALGQSTDGVAARVMAAMDDLRKTFTEGLSARLNSANGQGYLNDAAELLKQFQKDSADATSIGLDQMQLAAVFRAEAQKIVDDAGLVGGAFTQFTELFPEFSGMVSQSATAMQAANDKIMESAKELVNFVQGIAKKITDYLQGLKTGASSILSPQAQLASAQSNFNAQLSLAQGGDRDALSGITEVAQTLLDQAKSFYASSAGYTDIYAQVTAALQGLSGIDSGTVANADAQALIAAVNGTTAAVTTTGASNDNLTAAQSAMIAAQTALAAQQTTYLQTQVSLLGAINTLADRFVGAINGLGVITAGIGNANAGQNREIISWLISLSRSAAQSANQTVWSYLGFQNGGMIPGYASGGIVGNGIAGVDSVVARYAGGGTIALAGQEGILTRDATSAIGGAATVDYINRNLRLPQMAPMPGFRAPNDSARTSPANVDWQGLARANKQISDVSDERLSNKLDEIADVFTELAPKLAAELRRAMAGTKPRAA